MPKQKKSTKKPKGKVRPRKPKWTIGDYPKEFLKYFKRYPQHTSVIPVFEQDVQDDPFRHPLGRIIPIARDDLYIDGTYRWGRSGQHPTRIVYYPNKEITTVEPLDIYTTPSARYKKR